MVRVSRLAGMEQVGDPTVSDLRVRTSAEPRFRDTAMSRRAEVARRQCRSTSSGFMEAIIDPLRIFRMDLLGLDGLLPLNQEANSADDNILREPRLI